MTFKDVKLTIDIRTLLDNPFQSRKKYEDVSMLAESIAAQGLLQPPVARLVSKLRKRLKSESSYQKRLEKLAQGETPSFELAFGHRRVRALCQLAESDPSYHQLELTIRDLSDEEMRSIVLTENLQRSDVHPYHQAQQVAELVQITNGATGTIAKQLGQTKRWVVEHLRYLDLPTETAELWLSGILTKQHINVLIKYPAAAQQQAFDSLLATETEWDEAHEKRVVVGYSCTRTPQEFAEYCKGNIQIDLEMAKFPLVDEELILERGSCLTCPHNTYNQSTLFPDLESSSGVCTLPACFQAKSVAYLKQRFDDAQAQGHELQLITKRYYPAAVITEAFADFDSEVIGTEQYRSKLTDRSGRELTPNAVGIYCNWLDPETFGEQIPIIIRGKDGSEVLETWIDGHKRKLHNRQLRRESQSLKDERVIREKVAYAIAKLHTHEPLSDTLTEMLFGVIFSWSSADCIKQLAEYVKESWLLSNQLEPEYLDPEVWSSMGVSKWKEMLSGTQQMAAIRFLLLMTSAISEYSFGQYLLQSEQDLEWIRENIASEVKAERQVSWDKQDEQTAQEETRYAKRMQEIHDLSENPDSWFSKIIIQGNWDELALHLRLTPKRVRRYARLLKIKLKTEATDEEIVATFSRYREVVVQELEAWQVSQKVELIK